jgi:ABC-type proline/glycine betaine transport system substrate-binding protein
MMKRIVALIFVCMSVFLAASPLAHSQSNEKKVTITFVRWPYI